MRTLAHQYFCWFGRTNSHRSTLPLIWAVHKSYSFKCTNQILAINFLWGLQLKLDPPTDKKATEICQDRTPTRLIGPKILAVKESQSSWSQQAAHSKRKTSATTSGASLTSGRGLGQDGALRGEPAGGGHLFIATRDPDKSHDYHRMYRSAATVRLDANCSRAERVGFECR